MQGFFILDKKVREKRPRRKKTIDEYLKNYVYVIDEGGESEHYF
jgi:hypothetical protein